MYIALSVLLAASMFVVYVMTRPAAFRIARSRTFAGATPAELLAWIDDFHRWTAWSPWEKLDPSMARVYEGAPSGVGARYRWKGAKKVGEGSMAITDVAPDRVVLDLEFIAPFPAKNVTSFATEAADGGTRLTWSMEGRNDSFGSKLFGTIMNMDKLVGRDFEKGLASLEQALGAARAPRGEGIAA
jgi:hypothetical protein